MRAVYIVAGIVAMGWGLSLIAVTCAFASLIDPSLPDAAWRAEFIGKLASPEGMSGIGQGLLLICAGGWLAFGWPRRRARRDPEIELRDPEVG